MYSRRRFLNALFGGFAAAVVTAVTTTSADAVGFFDFLLPHPKRGSQRRRVKPARVRLKRHKVSKRQRHKKLVNRAPGRSSYAGGKIVDYTSSEKPGTIIINTSERALYRILGNGQAKRYGVAVGKEGFQWSGTARVGMKRENPTWTPPTEMIERVPEYAKWANGMPGGLPINPLGPRAMYLYKNGDTGFRIHGTIHPSSIGHAASSGCIRMINREVIELYGLTRVGTKVIVI